MGDMPQYGWNSQQQGAWNDQSQTNSSNTLPVWQGTVKKGKAPPAYRFQGPRIGLTPNYSGANAPMMDNTAPAGTFTNVINQAAQGYVNAKAKQGIEAEAAKDEALRKGMKGARAKNKISDLRTQKTQAAQAAADAAQKLAQANAQKNAQATKTGQSFVSQYQQATNPTGYNLLAQQVKQFQGNPLNFPPSGSAVTSLPAPNPATPMSNTGVPALPLTRPQRQARPLNANAPQLPSPFPPPMTPASSTTGSATPAPPATPFSMPAMPAMPPAPPKSVKKAGTTNSPFDLPPLTGMGGDLFTQSIKNMPESEAGASTPSNVQWKDEPTNPFPMGTRKPFDSSRMFDPSYKSTEGITSSPSSRTMNRPRK